MLDPAVFYWFNGQGDLEGLLACHVDDFLYGGSPWFEKSVISEVRKEFVVGTEEENSFKYVGVNIQYNEGKILFDQNFYANNLEYIDLPKERARQKDSVVTEQERKMMRAKIGQLLWLGRQSRPDIIFDACELAGRVKDAKVKDLLDTNKVLKKAKSESVTLRFSKLQDPAMMVYSDASFGNLDNGGTQGGHFVCLQGKGGCISPLGWSSKKIRRVVRSTIAGETLAMADALDTGFYLASLYTELLFGTPEPERLGIVCLTDCKSLYEAVKSNKAVTERRLRIEISAVKEAMDKLQVKEVTWISASDQLADVLTKKGASPLKLLSVLENGLITT